MDIELLPVIFMLTYLRHFMRQNKLYPEWDKKISNIIVGVVVVFILQTIFSKTRTPLMWLAFAAIAWLSNLIITKKEFAGAKPVLNAVLPFAVLALLGELIKLVSRSFYYDINTYLDTAKSFALLWMFAMWIIDSRQKKALQKERLKAEQAEKEVKITEAIKQELEVQVNERTAALISQKEALQKTLEELKSTQAQLIQAEKMASLGELTAGIAHEIQNPLNFVNNFSEVSNELIEELVQERSKPEGERDKGLEDDIIDDLKQNLEKINHHGKRADSIVKGMLQHSRKSTGQKELIDINALADEYLRLSYHGLRAKDKTFNAAIKTELDATLQKVNIIPQDFGRVLLNLYNNAFYAVNEKSKDTVAGGSDNKYQPTVTLITKRINNNICITVKDNGGGIPEAVKNKIFQPFFTTKPTGVGTGLGLSLSYDIIKAHGGEIKLETKEGEGTEFNILIPAN